MVKHLSIALLMCGVNSLHAVKIVNNTRESVTIYYSRLHLTDARVNKELVIHGLSSRTIDNLKEFTLITNKEEKIITDFDDAGEIVIEDVKKVTYSVNQQEVWSDTIKS